MTGKDQPEVSAKLFAQIYGCLSALTSTWEESGCEAGNVSETGEDGLHAVKASLQDRPGYQLCRHCQRRDAPAPARRATRSPARSAMFGSCVLPGACPVSGRDRAVTCPRWPPRAALRMARGPYTADRTRAARHRRDAARLPSALVRDGSRHCAELLALRGSARSKAPWHILPGLQAGGLGVWLPVQGLCRAMTNGHGKRLGVKKMGPVNIHKARTP